MFDRLSAEFGLHQSALALRQQRQEVLAANIANADTPHYKARDLDFRQQMSQAIQTQEQSQGTRLSLTSARHIPGGQMTSISSELKYRIPAQPSLDGNTVDMDAERVAFADNSMGYQSSLSILSQRIKTLGAALQP
ncbi:MAG TPA: flagellar basal body rod protein FlgB [Paenalcaligenes sp.]|nr:flagellar basal body rod protein FlgB [Paenalcaligenes sp.]